jgi:uncharacterized protein YndB with AHSA1/START domain
MPTDGWVHEDAIETDAPAEAIWRLWSDVEGWGSWIGDIESVSIDGPFMAGSTISMKPTGQDLVQLRLSEVVENEQFVDVAEIDGVVIRTLHRIEPIGEAGRLRIVYRMEISGPEAVTVGPELGPQITADFPETLAALVAQAER